MSDRTFDPKTILESYRTAFAPVVKAQEEGVKALDKVGRYQYAVAGDYLEWSLAQAQLALRAPTPTDFFTKQVELTTALSEKPNCFTDSASSESRAHRCVSRCSG